MSYNVRIRSAAYGDIAGLPLRDARKVDKILLGLEDNPRPHG